MRTLVYILLLNIAVVQAQDPSLYYKNKKTAVTDTILIDTVSIHPRTFKVFDIQNREVDTAFYTVDFKKARLIVKNPAFPRDSVTLYYLGYPGFITRTYRVLNRNIIVDNPTVTDRFYAIDQPQKKEVTRLFDGLSTSGSIARGITVGNNQNAVLNSQLDLQISGKIAPDVTLRASIQDANIPLQESGYSQRLDEFDQVFIALESPDWNVRAGDVNLENSDTYFMQFTKKIQGVSVAANLNGKNTATQVFGAGALVRGNFAQSQFKGQEGNQGPYKLKGPNGELFILIVSGSERVIVNGVRLERGEDKDYVIDYNAGELLFTPRYPVTSEMRILVEYQYTNNNYTRFITYGGAVHQTGGLTIGAYLYSESDARNQPLLQNLTENQINILAGAGDKPELMVAPSAVEDTYSDNKILYRKILVNNIEVFEYSNNPDDELFNVRFTFAGDNQGNYILANADAIGKIYEYVMPVGGIPQGNYEPVVRLHAPEKLQMMVIRADYRPSEKTGLSFESSVSNKDLNLFSGMDDKDNRGFAGRVAVEQELFNKAWSGTVFLSHDYVSSEYRNLEGLFQEEFNRDWDLFADSGDQLLEHIFVDQSLLHSGITFFHPEKGRVEYHFEHLNLKDYASGNRHGIHTDLILKKFRFQTAGSLMHNTTTTTRSVFARLNSRGIYHFNKAWTGAGFQTEDNRQTQLATGTLTPFSQRFYEYRAFFGVGDSTRVFAEAGYTFRVTDSVRNGALTRFNTSDTYYIDSRLLAGENARLSAFVSFRDFKYEEEQAEDEKSLNSRIQYSQKLFADYLQLGSVYETLSGTLPRQEFTYLEVEPGQGAFTWKDYNGNGIQELNEFEPAQFQDEALYIRILLPNQVFIKTHQHRFSQTLTLNFGQWINEKGFKKALSHFYNQTAYLIDRKVRRNGDNFNLNPFASAESGEVLGLQQNFRNSLFFNRGRQHYTTAYTWLLNRARNLLSTGLQENNVRMHQLQLTHKINDLWLVNLSGITSNTQSFSENFINRNYEISAYGVNPKLSYLLNRNSRFTLLYEYEDKKNHLGEESLRQHRAGMAFAYADTQKISISGEYNFFKNDFEGNSFSPVGYQLLEGLQPGNNSTWTLLAQKRITQFLDLNLSYFGRKAEGSKTIHTGSIQVKAYF